MFHFIFFFLVLIWRRDCSFAIQKWIFFFLAKQSLNDMLCWRRNFPTYNHFFFILLGRLLIMNLKFSHSRSYYLVSRSSSSRENSNFHIHSLHFKLAGWIVHVVSFFFLYRSKLKFFKAKVVSHLVYLDDFF